MNTMLLSFSHPDDESFSCAGTVAKYIQNGWTAYLVVATNGEAGSSGGMPATGDDLGKVRQNETNKAANEIGIKQVHFLGFRDGMLNETEPGDMEEKLFQAMKSSLPDIVITYDSMGMSNHPDHIRTSFATTYAFQKYAKYLKNLASNEPFTGRGKEWHEADITRSFTDAKVSPEPKLYYVCIPESVATYMKRVGAHPEEAYGHPWTGIPDAKVTTMIDIKRTAPIKKRALKCHKSQIEDVKKYLGPGVKNPFLQYEYFLLRMQGVYEVFMGKTERMESAL